jgi:hypothetical protein
MFDVRHNDRVGGLRIPAGDYTVTLLGGNLTCATAERFSPGSWRARSVTCRVTGSCSRRRRSS